MKRLSILLVLSFSLLLSCKKDQQAPAVTSLEATNQPQPQIEVVAPPNYIQTAYYWCEPWPQLTYRPTYNWWIASFTNHSVYLKHASAGGNWGLAGLSVKQANGNFILNKLLASGTWWMYFTSPGGLPPNNTYTPANCKCVRAFTVSCGPPPASGD